jgi:serine/threonine protein kinase
MGLDCDPPHWTSRPDSRQTATDRHLQPGIELPGYRIERLIARGGMGEVYEATQLSLERRVALKIIARELGSKEFFRERFRREARAAAAIDHPNVLPIYETGSLETGRLFIAMRLVAGPDLNSLLQERGPLPIDQAIALLTQIAEALDAAHACGLVHRDVKPANVMLEAHANGWHPYLTDFGLVQSEDQPPEHAPADNLFGSLDYMAPERFLGAPLDERADVYSFGCLVYRCLTDRVPFERDTREAVMAAHTEAPIPLPSGTVCSLPTALDIVVLRAMEKDPGKRPRSAGTLMRWGCSHLHTHRTPIPLVTDESPTQEAILCAPNSVSRVRTGP